MATTETRYFKNASTTVNGLSCYPLAPDQSGTKKTESRVVAAFYTGAYVGIRVWKRDSAGTETEITGGTPVAQIPAQDGDVQVEYDATYTPDATSLSITDSIVVRAYVSWGATATWLQIGLAIFTTEQLGATQLDAVEWTVHYIISMTAEFGPPWKTGIYFMFDGDAPARITNFQWSITVTAIKEEGDGLTFYTN